MKRKARPGIGIWWAECCLHDLYQVVSAEDLQELTKRMSPDEVEETGPVHGIWNTLDDALHDLVAEQDGETVSDWLRYRQNKYPETDWAAALGRTKR